MINFNAYKSCLVVAAHPDDEVLGCGGSIVEMKKAGVNVSVLFATNGKGGRVSTDHSSDATIKKAQDQLSKEMAQACEVLGINQTHALNFPDNRLDTVSKMDLSLAIQEFASNATPDIVLTHHRGDYNWDHQIVFDACMMAFRANAGDDFPNTILSFEVLSSTERAFQTSSSVFCPNIYVDISKSIETKKKALSCYTSENYPYPHPRSIEGVDILAKKRGLEVGLHFAECFELIRHIT